MRELQYFSATWCQPCKMMKPIVEYTAKQYNIPIKYVDIEVERDAPTTYNITTVPTFILMENGKELRRVSGAIPPAKFQGFFQ